MARVTMKNAAATVVLLANNLDNINSALGNARSYVKTINSFVSHIRAAGDKVNSGGWMTKTVKFIEDIPVIGWFVKTVRRAVEEYVIDPVMDEAMGLAYGLIQPIIEKKGLAPETSINDFVTIYDEAMEVKSISMRPKKTSTRKRRRGKKWQRWAHPPRSPLGKMPRGTSTAKPSRQSVQSVASTKSTRDTTQTPPRLTAGWVFFWFGTTLARVTWRAFGKVVTIGASPTGRLDSNGGVPFDFVYALSS